MKTLLPTILISLLLLCSCSHDTPQRDRGPLPGHGSGEGTGQRPGLGDTPAPFDSELKDAVWRFTGPSASLRYDRGGVLFTTDARGSISITDLDGATVIAATLGTPGTDSLCTASVNINGQPLSIISTRLRGRTRQAVWYEITDTDSARHVLVTPP